jgi:hypothetical protein
MKAHPYTVADGGTQRVWLALAVISIGVAVLMVFFIVPILLALAVRVFPSHSDAGKLQEAWEALGPVVHGSPLLVCYFVVYAVFDRWAWKWIDQVPDLNGTWKGNLVSEKRPDAPFPVTLKIEQTWSKIMITIESAATFSRSVNASVTFEGSGRVRLINTYLAEPRPGANPPAITRHFGTNIFHLSFGSKGLAEIVGDYYTERNHGSTGFFQFK